MIVTKRGVLLCKFQPFFFNTFLENDFNIFAIQMHRDANLTLPQKDQLINCQPRVIIYLVVLESWMLYTTIQPQRRIFSVFIIHCLCTW